MLAKEVMKREGDLIFFFLFFLLLIHKRVRDILVISLGLITLLRSEEEYIFLELRG